MTLESLSEKSDLDLFKIPGIGRLALQEIIDCLAARGIVLDEKINKNCQVASSGSTLLPTRVTNPTLALRDYFAAKALSSITINETNVQGVAATAYEVADAMLAVRNAPTEAQ